MNESKTSAADEYLEKSKNWITDEKRHRFEAVAEMMRHPMTLHEMKAQVMRHQATSNWYRKHGGQPLPPRIEAKCKPPLISAS